MSALDATMRTVHLLVGAVWVGAVVFVALGVLPLAREGELNAAPLERIVGRLTTVSRASALLLFVTGGHLAGTGYTTESLTGTTRGYLVLAMLVLWLVLTALVEVGASRLSDGFAEKKVRAPARNHGKWIQAAAVVGILLLVDAGALTSGLL